MVEPTHLKNISQIGNLFPDSGENKKCLKPPPSYSIFGKKTRFQLDTIKPPRSCRLELRHCAKVLSLGFTTPETRHGYLRKSTCNPNGGPLFWLEVKFGLVVRENLDLAKSRGQKWALGPKGQENHGEKKRSHPWFWGPRNSSWYLRSKEMMFRKIFLINDWKWLSKRKNNLFLDEGIFAQWIYTPENWTCWNPRNIGCYWVDLSHVCSRVCMEGFPTLARVISTRAWNRGQQPKPRHLFFCETKKLKTSHIPSRTLT